MSKIAKVPYQKKYLAPKNISIFVLKSLYFAD